MGFVDEAGVFVDTEFADDDVGNRLQLAGGEGVGKQQVDRAGEAVDAERSPLTAEGDVSLLGDCIDAQQALRPGLGVGNEVTVRELREVVGVSLDAKDSFQK